MVGGLLLGADDDEQYKEEQPREGQFLAGAMNCWEEFSHLSLSLSLSLYASNLSILLSLTGLSFLSSNPHPLALWAAGPIYRGPGPLPNIEWEGSQQWQANLKGQQVSTILTKAVFAYAKLW